MFLWTAFFVNEEMVRDGLALVTRLSNEEKYLTDLIKAEREAHKERRGVWADTVIDPYPVRLQKKSRFPWATKDQIKKGFK